MDICSPVVLNVKEIAGRLYKKELQNTVQTESRIMKKVIKQKGQKVYVKQ